MNSHDHRCHGGFSLDEATRRSWYNPEEAISDLNEGMTFVDVGCGDGFFSLLAARRVGPKGRVYAVDIDGSKIELLEDKADAEGLENIVAVVGRAEDTVFCESCVDMVLFSMDLHDFDNPGQVIANAKLMLKPNGKVIDLDWKKIQMEFGPPYEVRFSEKKAQEMLATGGFESKVRAAGPYHYMVTASHKSRR